ncbi:methyl-accepting chemotaxis protein [Erwinia piriflorinigrans]|uniref:Methyl-accepting chemotaxis serine transducer n=1 Tax=Erwinia piriflorinigrans CFBP 5888 TaxID=1161919 RepID=V5ZCG1_9GAMM|nr:PAS domain-containing methyl-accepting chemotaxis protein [Erwinia piriflorinigrans]CCG88722.1 Methyl-accepting chemotaxis serine transducer [Erwinia piriflorinigrans CFBP 5888]
MRKNLPVTQQEYVFDDDATLMSTTDINSAITYANDAFIEVSGFTPEEISGQPHNLVRHPDMPPEAFADMWSTLKKGEPWTALVKNRRKNGDHYWVRANAIPVVRNGNVQGFMSVRTKPSPQEIRVTERLYQKFRNGKAKGLRFNKGIIVRSGLMSWRSIFKTLPLRWRIRSVLITLLPLATLGVWGLGVSHGALALFASGMALLLLLACVWLEMQISRPIERICQQALRVATGADHKVEQMDRVDEVGTTLRAVGQLGLMFRWLVDDVSGQAVNVLSASDAIAQSNSELSRRTGQTAANVQQTAATMNQMTATVKSNTETAAKVNSLSTNTSHSAIQGGNAMEDMVKMMAEITESSRKITSITSVIDGIAFQTNILALNAAVEAARAGEQGKGFAVVAGEVRSLAQRSAKAASEIKMLLENSADKVKSGTLHVNETGKTMENIVSQVQNVSSLIAQISAASAEQETAINEIGKAVEELDNITHQNAARVEEGAQASGRMTRQATRLVDAIGVFR